MEAETKTEMNEVITFDIQQIRTSAEQYFIRICGLDKEGVKFDKMRKIAEAVHKELLPRIEAKAVLRKIEASAFFHNEEAPEKLEIDNQVLHCHAFARLDFRKIKSAYFYLLTCGGIQTQSESIMEQFYTDTWGTAYVDSARDAIYDIIKTRETGYCVTTSFGPGYFGMDIRQGKKFFRLLDASSIGVRYHQDGIMLPVKSCVGVYFVQASGQQMELSACEGCDSQKGCRFCEIYIKGIT